jgi:hypothetical protein
MILLFNDLQWYIFTNAIRVAAIPPSKLYVTLPIAHTVAELLGPASSHIGPTPSKVSRERESNPRQYRAAKLSSSGRWLFHAYNAECLQPLHEDQKEYSKICTTTTKLNPILLGDEVNGKKIQRMCLYRCTLVARHKPLKGSEPRSARAGRMLHFPMKIHVYVG